MATDDRVAQAGRAGRWRAPSPPTFHRNVWLMLTYTLGKGLQLSISAITINLYAYSLGYRQEFIGLLVGMTALGTLLAALPVGVLADRLGRKPPLLVSAILTPLTLLAIALSHSAPTLLAASFCNGLLASAYWVTNLPILTESTRDADRVRVLALNSFLLLGAGALGSLIGGAVPQLAGALTHLPTNSAEPLRWGVVAAALVAALPAAPLFWLRESRRLAPPETPTGATAAATRGGGWALVALFAMLLLPDVLFTTGENAIVGLLQLYFALRFRLMPGQLGIILTLAGLCGGAATFSAPWLARRFGQLRLAVALQYLGAPVALLIGFAPGLGLAMGAEFLRNALRGLFEPTYAAFTMGRAPANHRATLSGLYGVTWGVGAGVGAGLAGVLQQRVALGAPFAFGALCLVISPTLLILFFGRAPRDRTPPRPA